MMKIYTFLLSIISLTPSYASSLPFLLEDDEVYRQQFNQVMKPAVDKGVEGQFPPDMLARYFRMESRARKLMVETFDEQMGKGQGYPANAFNQSFLDVVEFIRQAEMSGQTEFSINAPGDILSWEDAAPVVQDLRLIPREIGRLVQLRKLAIYSENEVSRLPGTTGPYNLPEEVGNLRNLLHLIIQGTSIQTLPPNLFYVTSLTKLELTRNKLTVLAPEIGQLSNLEGLYLSQNSLKKLPNTIGDLTSLKYLDVSENLLYKLPKSLKKLRKLQGLSLSGNHLVKLPWLDSLDSLTDLNIANNMLEEIPDWIGSLPLLKSLAFSENQIQDFSLSFVGLAAKNGVSFYGFDSNPLSYRSHINLLFSHRFSFICEDELNVAWIAISVTAEVLGAVLFAQETYIMLDRYLF